MLDVKSCSCWKTCTTKVERLFWSLTMMPSPPPLRARSSYATEKSFLIVKRPLNPCRLLWKVPGESPEACFAGDPQHAPLSAAHHPDDTRNCGGHCFAHRTFLNW